MPARIHQDYGRYLLRHGDLRETRGERERRRKKKKKEDKKRKRERRRSFVSVFVYHESGRAFSTRRVSRGCFMAIVCARQMAQKRDRMLPLGEPSGLKYDRGGKRCGEWCYGSILYK